MPRGQYDRAAAKARREGTTSRLPDDYKFGQWSNMKLGQQMSDAQALASHPNWDGRFQPVKLENPVISIVDAHGQPVSQADYDALLNQRDRLLRLCQTHGLMVE